MTRRRVVVEKQFGEGEILAKNPISPLRAPFLDETSSLKAPEAPKKDIDDVHDVCDQFRTHGASGLIAGLYH